MSTSRAARCFRSALLPPPSLLPVALDPRRADRSSADCSMLPATPKPQRPYHPQAQLFGGLCELPRRACSREGVQLCPGGLGLLETGGGIPRTEEPGTVVVDPASRHLYFVEAPGRATRYGVGVGREGFGWSGIGKDQHVAQLARLGAAEGDGGTRPADPLTTCGDVTRAGRSRRSEEPAGGERDVSLRGWRRHRLPHPRHHGA